MPQIGGEPLWICDYLELAAIILECLVEELIDLLTTEVTSDDLTCGIEEDDLRNPCDTIELRSFGLIENLRPSDLELLHCLEVVFHLIPYDRTEDDEPLVGVSIAYLLQVSDLTTAGTAP